MKILVVDDETKLADALGELFKQNGDQCDVVYSGTDALATIGAKDYDVIVLDVMMPVIDGFEVVKRLRNNGHTVPVIMLTAKDDVASKVKGLDCGADDYLSKPFATEELIARVNALARRAKKDVADCIIFKDLSLNTTNYTLFCGKKSVRLGAKEYAILKLLLSNPLQVISKETITTKVWGTTDVSDNNIEAYMSFIRKKMSFIGSKLTIMTKRMLGYYLETDN